MSPRCHGLWLGWGMLEESAGLALCLVQPACAPWLSPGLVAGHLALVTVLNVSPSGHGLGVMELSLGSCLSSCMQPGGFFHPCQDLIMCSHFYQNAKQQLNIGCNSVDYGFSN